MIYLGIVRVIAVSGLEGLKYNNYFRYAAATQIWKGRLHVMGGSKENRHTPGTDHWSIAVKDGKAIEKEWRNETPIPRGGPHRYMDSILLCEEVSGNVPSFFPIQSSI